FAELAVAQTAVERTREAFGRDRRRRTGPVAIDVHAEAFTVDSGRKAPGQQYISQILAIQTSAVPAPGGARRTPPTGAARHLQATQIQVQLAEGDPGGARPCLERPGANRLSAQPELIDLEVQGRHLPGIE